MLTVHHLNNSRSQRVLWLLEELGVPYEIVRYQRQSDMRESRIRNGLLKTKERQRRDQRMADLIQKQGQLPYSPVVMSWLSEQLDRKSTRLNSSHRSLSRMPSSA